MRTSSSQLGNSVEELFGALHRDGGVGLAVEHDRGRGDLGQAIGDVVAADQARGTARG